MNYLWAFHTPTLTIFYGSGLWNLDIIPQTYHACILYSNPPTLEFYFYIAYLKAVEISSNHESFVFEYIPVVTTSRPIFFPTKEALCNKQTNKIIVRHAQLLIQPWIYASFVLSTIAELS